MLRCFVVFCFSLGFMLPAYALDSSTSSTSGLSTPDDDDRLARRRRKKTTKRPKVVEVPEEGSGTATAEELAPIAPAQRGPSRVDFDERVIKGQTNKANAIYLFQRRESRLRTLVKKRAHFHELIDETLE